MSERYRNYTIEYYPPPIPTRQFDFQFVHDDYDGAEDSNDRRAGHAESPAACREAIDEIEDDL